MNAALQKTQHFEGKSEINAASSNAALIRKNHLEKVVFVGRKA